MSPSPVLTDEVVVAYLKCPYKAHLKLRGASGKQTEFEHSQAGLTAEYRIAARQALLRARGLATAVQNPPDLRHAIRGAAALILDATLCDAEESCHLDALERTGDKMAGPRGAYAPVLFTPHERVTHDDRLRLAFGANILARIQGVWPDSGRIIHGRQFKVSRVALATLSGPARDVVGQVRAMGESTAPPPLLLNRHCVECEFRQSCHAAAVEKDDLSLLRGLSPKDIAGLNRRGIFTVTQYSYTFRPGRLKWAAGAKGGKHDHSLQALAVRESKVYVARRPQLRDGRVRVYMDVEGLPDQGFYYLIGLLLDDGTGRRQLSFWANREADERVSWDAFLRVVRGLGEDFVLYHYGSYETQFLKRMKERYGGDPEILVRLAPRSVNVLSAIHARVYFPVYANDLKSVAGCLGIRWSAADATGLQAIVWRCDWEATGDESVKQRLLTYNQEDCSALEAIVAAVRSFEDEAVPSDGGPGPPVAGVDEIERPAHRKYGRPRFALPEFAGITKCAYFDYQRDKVLCRTSPALKQSLRRKYRPRRIGWPVNQDIECEDVRICPYCGSTALDTSSRYQRRVIDLKLCRGGVKRWVTRYRVIRRRCRRCWKTFLPEAYRALPSKYGWGFCSWVVYASISLRQTNHAVAESLQDLFGIPMPSGMVSRIRRNMVGQYRATYEALLADLRKGPVVHADETQVGVKGLNSNGYVWVFASPDTAVYVYAPANNSPIGQPFATRRAAARRTHAVVVVALPGSAMLTHSGDCGFMATVMTIWFAISLHSTAPDWKSKPT
jgi:predicted RecB family nuclease